MKKILMLIVALMGATMQLMADKVVPSVTLPDVGKPEHVYTMVNGNGVYSNALTAPTQTAENTLT